MPRPGNPRNTRKIAIPQVRDDRQPVEYRIKLDPSTNDDLLLYQKLYERTYGQKIEPKDLLEPIIRRFLSTDREFRRFRKEQSETSVPNEPSQGAQPSSPDSSQRSI